MSTLQTFPASPVVTRRDTLLAGELMKPLLFVLFAVTAQASPIITMSAHCFQVGFPTQDGTELCYAGTTAAHNSAVYVPQATTADYAQLLVGSSSFAAEFSGGGVQGATSMAQADAFFSETMQTAGSVRAGRLQFASQGGGLFNSPNATASFVIGQLSGGRSASGCYFSVAPTFSSSCLADFAFTLGTSFLVSETTHAAMCGCSPSNSGGGAMTDVGVMFRFTELDGTPVAVQAATHNPEPGTWLMLGTGMLALAWRRRYDLFKCTNAARSLSY